MPQIYIIGYIIDFLEVYGTYIYYAVVVASTAYTIRSNQIQKNRINSAIRDAMGITQSVRNTVQPRNYIYGRRRVGGPWVYAQESGADRKYLNIVQALASHEVDAMESFFFNEEQVYRSGDGSIGGTYSGKAWIHYNTGYSGQSALSPLLANCYTVDSNFVGNGIAYMYAFLTYDTNVFANGIPNLSAVIR